MIKISETEIHLWCRSLCIPCEELHRFYGILSQDEQQRSERFHFTHHRNMSIVSRGFLRTILGKYLHMPPERLCFGYNRFGKPRLVGEGSKEGLYFNVTHSGDLFLCAVARNHEIGIDIERMRCLRSGGLKESVFSPAEKTEYDALPAELKLIAFFLCWVRKEALLKAWGVGLSYPLRQLSVTIVPGEPPKLKSSGMSLTDNSGWQIFDVIVDTGHVAALAVPCLNVNIIFHYQASYLA